MKSYKKNLKSRKTKLSRKTKSRKTKSRKFKRGGGEQIIEALKTEIDAIKLNPDYMRSYSFEIGGRKFSIVRVSQIKKNNIIHSIIVINIGNGKITSIPEDKFLEMIESDEIKVFQLV